MPSNELLLISVGNTRTRFAPVAEGKLQPTRAVVNAGGGAGGGGGEGGPAALRSTLAEGIAGLAPGGRVVLASVNDPIADALAEEAVRLLGGPRLLRVGSGLKVPIAHELPAPVTVGVDRLLNALGAFTRSEEACVVIDAGTAITVDLVNTHGVFEGGVIAPGLATMLWSLHARTAALPELPVPRSAEELGDAALGNTTASAIRLGCVAALRGLARVQIDRYAERIGRYPRVIATGGDAPLLFEHDDLVEHIVPDLTLIGMLAAWQASGMSGED
jgi:type III pantothenate kinase